MLLQQIVNLSLSSCTSLKQSFGILIHVWSRTILETLDIDQSGATINTFAKIAKTFKIIYNVFNNLI